MNVFYFGETAEVAVWQIMIVVSGIVMIGIIGFLATKVLRAAKIRAAASKSASALIKQWFEDEFAGPLKYGRPSLFDGIHRFAVGGEIHSGFISELRRPVDVSPELVAIMDGPTFYAPPSYLCRTDSIRCSRCVARDGDCCTHFTPPLDLKTIPPQLCIHWRARPKDARVQIITIKGGK